MSGGRRSMRPDERSLASFPAASPSGQCEPEPDAPATTGAHLLALALPGQLLEQIAQHAAALALERLEASRQPVSPWLDAKAARAYLGFSRDRLYKLTAAGAIPHRKRRGGQRLLFYRAELDQWLAASYPRQAQADPSSEARQRR